MPDLEPILESPLEGFEEKLEQFLQFTGSEISQFDDFDNFAKTVKSQLKRLKHDQKNGLQIDENFLDKLELANFEIKSLKTRELANNIKEAKNDQQINQLLQGKKFDDTMLYIFELKKKHLPKQHPPNAHENLDKAITHIKDVLSLQKELSKTKKHINDLTAKLEKKTTKHKNLNTREDEIEEQYDDNLPKKEETKLALESYRITEKLSQLDDQIALLKDKIKTSQIKEKELQQTLKIKIANPQVETQTSPRSRLSSISMKVKNIARRLSARNPPTSSNIIPQNNKSPKDRYK